MKKILLLTLLLSGLNSFAQKINFKKENAKRPDGIHTQFNLSLSELNANQNANVISGKMKSIPEILKLDILNPTETSADILIVTDEKNDIESLQKALLAADFKVFIFDNKEYKISELKNILSSTK
jgi:hypothetical protein